MSLRFLVEKHLLNLCFSAVCVCVEFKSKREKNVVVFLQLTLISSIFGWHIHTKYGDALSSIFIDCQFHFQFMISYLFKSIRSKSSTLGKSSRNKASAHNHKIKWIGLYIYLFLEINFQIINNTSFTNVERS